MTANLIKKHVIMIVDDDLMVARSIARIFSVHNFESIIVNNPDEAIEKVKTILPNLVIMDIQMPGKDGVELLKEIRKFDKKTPVIMISGNMDMEKADILKKIGSNECFEKPLSPSIVISKVKELLGLN